MHIFCWKRSAIVHRYDTCPLNCVTIFYDFQRKCCQWFIYYYSIENCIILKMAITCHSKTVNALNTTFSFWFGFTNIFKPLAQSVTLKSIRFNQKWPALPITICVDCMTQIFIRKVLFGHWWYRTSLMWSIQYCKLNGKRRAIYSTFYCHDQWMGFMSSFNLISHLISSEM